MPKGAYMLRLNRPEAKNVARNFKNATSHYVFGLGWH